MSHKLSATDSGFWKEHTLKQLVHEEVYTALSEIKQEIEDKIREIDCNLMQLREDLNAVAAKNAANAPSVNINERISKVELDVTNLQNCYLNLNRKNQSIDREKLFKKASNPDLADIPLSDYSAYQYNINNTDIPQFSLKSCKPKAIPPLKSKEKPRLREDTIKQTAVSGNKVDQRPVEIRQRNSRQIGLTEIKQIPVVESDKKFMRQQRKVGINEQMGVSKEVLESLSKNKSSFTRKKSQQALKVSTPDHKNSRNEITKYESSNVIQEESVEQSFV